MASYQIEFVVSSIEDNHLSGLWNSRRSSVVVEDGMRRFPGLQARMSLTAAQAAWDTLAGTPEIEMVSPRPE